jgi:hypothetical protein
MMVFHKHGDKSSASENEDNIINVRITNFHTSLRIMLVGDLLVLLKARYGRGMELCAVLFVPT